MIFTYACLSTHQRIYFVRLSQVNAMVIFVMLILLSGCTSTPTVNKADAIKADDKHNIVFMGYDMAVGPIRLETQANPSGWARFVCENLDTGKSRACFNVPLRFHKTADGSYYSTTGLYTANGAAPYKVKFGRYRITSIRYSIIVGVDIHTTCKTDSKGHTHCYDTYHDRFDRGAAPLGDDLIFAVDDGDGCYLGHARLQMQFDDIIDFELSDNLASDVEYVREGLSEAIANHVTRSCIEPN